MSDAPAQHTPLSPTHARYDLQVTHEENPVDVVLIGGGIMSATLGVFLARVRPDWTIRVYERLGGIAEESSNPWNNAGTGHSALCELNYMPDPLDPTKAVSINEQFQLSRQFWASLVEDGTLGAPSSFINSVAHMTFVRSEKDVAYLKQRYETLKAQALFSDIEYSEDAATIARWAPLLIDKRAVSEIFAATHSDAGTDVNFGTLTAKLFHSLIDGGAHLDLDTEVVALKRNGKLWRVKTRRRAGRTTNTVDARFVFVGAGGWALKLLQKSGIPEAKGFGTFPISGKFLRTDNPAIVAQHRVKVYSQAEAGAPPMSVPHLDKRIVDGNESLLFGPYAGINPKFLKNGSVWDLPSNIRPGNVAPYLSVAVHNMTLLKYLIGELAASKSTQFGELRKFMPTADPKDWRMITAGQRAQVIKKNPAGGGILQFGTEVVAHSDGSIVGLLGASPGASTAVPIMLEVLEKCFPTQWPDFSAKLKSLIPTLGTALNDNPELAASTMERTAGVLGLIR